MDNAIWLPILNYENLYEVSSFGQVRRLKKLNNLRPGLSKGYYFVVLSKDCKGKISKIHRLVALAFIPNPENKPYVNHKDGNKLNNKLENLEWCTDQENRTHASKLGLLKRERKKYKNRKDRTLDMGIKLNRVQVLEIRALFGVLTQKELAHQYGVGLTAIRRIKSRKTWAHV